MNCQDMDKFIQVYLDREFAGADRADFEAHLAHCERCRRVARFEQAFKQQLKTSLAHPRLGLEDRERLRKQILEAIDSAPPEPAAGSQSRRWVLRALPAAAAAGLVAVLWVGLGDGPHRRPTTREAAQVGDMGLGAQTAEIDPRAAQSFYAKLLSFPVVPPRFRDGQTRLVAARLAQVDAERAAHLVYRHGDRELNLILSAHRPPVTRFLEPRRLGGKVVYVGRDGRRTVASFVHRGVAYTLSAELPVTTLTRLVRDVLDPSRDRRPPLPLGETPVDAVPASAPGGR